MDHFGIIKASCGVCCSKIILCPNCEISTLKTNRLKLELQSEISGKLNMWPGNGGFKYSDLYDTLSELMKHKKNYQIVNYETTP